MIVNRHTALDESYGESRYVYDLVPLRLVRPARRISRRCVLVALRLTGFVSPMRLTCSIITRLATGEIRPVCIRISTSQISVIFYGIMTLNTVSLVVNAAL